MTVLSNCRSYYMFPLSLLRALQASFVLTDDLSKRNIASRVACYFSVSFWVTE